ncbi:MAG: tetratricopeptide repeat protein, partial [Endomicrobiales bacterium]
TGEKIMMKKKAAPADTNEVALLEMAKFYFMNNKYDEAIEELAKVLEINPGNSGAYYNLGLIYENRNRADKAKEMFEKALDIVPGHKLAREHLNRLIGISDE